jgi:hypothetical protein
MIINEIEVSDCPWKSDQLVSIAEWLSYAQEIAMRDRLSSIDESGGFIYKAAKK